MESVMNNYQKITNSSQAAALLKDHMQCLDHEELWIAFLSGCNNLISKQMISMGSLRQTIIDVRTVIKNSLMNNASGIILIHNHPSGDPEPSALDIKETEHIMKACKLMDITLVDHVILSTDSYFSFADNSESMYNTQR